MKANSTSHQVFYGKINKVNLDTDGTGYPALLPELVLIEIIVLAAGKSKIKKEPGNPGHEKKMKKYLYQKGICLC